MRNTLMLAAVLSTACSSSTPTKPVAPILDNVMPMMGGLHVEWTNKEAACDAVEAERMSATEEYKMVFSVPGSAANKMDGTVPIGTEYMYRLRCKKSGVYSDYSNEKSGTRTQ